MRVCKSVYLSILIGSLRLLTTYISIYLSIYLSINVFQCLHILIYSFLSVSICSQIVYRSAFLPSPIPRVYIKLIFHLSQHWKFLSSFLHTIFAYTYTHIPTFYRYTYLYIIIIIIIITTISFLTIEFHAFIYSYRISSSCCKRPSETNHH